MTDQDLKDVSREMTDEEFFALQKELEGVSARAAEAFASGGVWIEMHLGAEQAVKERLEHPEESVFEMARRLYSGKFPAIAGNPDLIVDAAELQDDVGKAYVGPGREETVSWFLAARRPSRGSSR